jgi:hypothetical protein
MANGTQIDYAKMANVLGVTPHSVANLMCTIRKKINALAPVDNETAAGPATPKKGAGGGKGASPRKRGPAKGGEDSPAKKKKTSKGKGKNREESEEDEPHVKEEDKDADGEPEFPELPKP